MKRTIALLLGAALGALLLATPAHATPEPAPTADAAPSPTAPADPCAFPTPQPTLEEVPQAAGPAVLDIRKKPKLPPRECFVELVDTCEGTLVTLKNPIPRIPIKYLVDGEEGTHTVGSGETEGPIFVPKSQSPFGVFIVVSDDPDGPKLPIIRKHEWVEPKDCQTASPSPSPVVPSPAESEDVPQLPVTGQNLAGLMGVGFTALGLLVVLLVGAWVFGLVKRRRSVA